MRRRVSWQERVTCIVALIGVYVATMAAADAWIGTASAAAWLGILVGRISSEIIAFNAYRGELLGDDP